MDYDLSNIFLFLLGGGGLGNLGSSRHCREPDVCQLCGGGIECLLIPKSLRSATWRVCEEGFLEQITEETADGITAGQSRGGFSEMEGAPETKGGEGSAGREGATVASIQVMPVGPRSAQWDLSLMISLCEAMWRYSRICATVHNVIRTFEVDAGVLAQRFELDGCHYDTYL